MTSQHEAERFKRFLDELPLPPSPGELKRALAKQKADDPNGYERQRQFVEQSLLELIDRKVDEIRADPTLIDRVREIFGMPFEQLKAGHIDELRVFAYYFAICAMHDKIKRTVPGLAALALAPEMI